MKSKESSKLAFLKRARQKHGQRYSYDRVRYVNARTPVEVVCSHHGSWMVTPYAHAPAKEEKRGSGCPKCAGQHRTKSDLINQAHSIHGAKYDYSKTVFVDSRTPFEVYCPKHKKAWKTTWYTHITMGHGCQKCGAERTFDIAVFVRRAIELHGDEYDYSQLGAWKGWHKPLPIICKVCGHRFLQRPSVHLHQRAGCPKCSARRRGRNSRDSNEEFIRKAQAVHGDQYDYSSVEYRADGEQVNIICRTHGAFLQRADHHKSGAGCQKCHFEAMQTERSYDFADFLRIAEDQHMKRYNYDASSWRGYAEKVRIQCPDHGWFTQSASGHASGSGCPACNESRGEREIARLLKRENIEFERQKKFSGCKDQRALPFDFYVPGYDLLIEYDGEQHFYERETGIFTKDSLKAIKRRDGIKTEFCKMSGKHLVRIRYDQDIEAELSFLLAKER